MAASGNELGDEFLSHATHELRGSLNAILGWAEFLRSGPCDDAARVRAAETIIRHARQQTWMIGELMDTWRLASGILKFADLPFDVLHAVRSAVDAVEPLARAKAIRVEIRTEAIVPPKSRGDVKRVTQAMVTLLWNAIHFAPDASVVTVALAMEATGRAVDVLIHDLGTPVSPDVLPQLFDRIRGGDGNRTSGRATFRLGLSFVRDVIARQGGWVDADRGLDGGMVFRLSLPLETLPDGVDPVRPTDEAAVDAVGQHLRGLRVLLIDDEPDAREALTHILEHHGAIVQAAGSAADGIAIIQHAPVDVLLADIGMPGADGYDLIRYIRALESTTASRVPAMAVTAFASDADRRRALDAGYQMHLAKPVDPAVLVGAVARLGRSAVGGPDRQRSSTETQRR